ncbi:MAG: hypothetical protein ACRC92_21790 [Peptostreptococcaceae bacterium]
MATWRDVYKIKKIKDVKVKGYTKFLLSNLTRGVRWNNTTIVAGLESASSVDTIHKQEVVINQWGDNNTCEITGYQTKYKNKVLGNYRLVEYDYSNIQGTHRVINRQYNFYESNPCKSFFLAIEIIAVGVEMYSYGTWEFDIYVGGNFIKHMKNGEFSSYDSDYVLNVDRAYDRFVTCQFVLYNTSNGNVEIRNLRINHERKRNRCALIVQIGLLEYIAENNTEISNTTTSAFIYEQ